MIPATDDHSRHVLLIKVFVFVTCLLTTTTFLSFETTLLLYMNHVKFTTPTDTVFFVRLMSLSLVIPLVASPVLGSCSVRFGPRLTLTCSYFIAMLGFCVVAFSKSNPWGFIIGYTMCSISISLRVIRYSLIGDFIPSEQRTRVMAIHQFMSLLGFLIAPLFWLSIQGRHISLLSSTITLNPFSINFLFCMILAAINMTLSCTVLTVRPPSHNAAEPQNDTETHTTTNLSPTEYGSTSVIAIDTVDTNSNRPEIDLKKYRNIRIAYFTIVIMLTRLSLYLYLSIFQPIMIGYFKFNDRDMGFTYIVIGILSLIPPIIIACLTKILSDRYILLCGLVIKILGAVIFLPLFGPVQKWQPVAGYILVVKATVFCSTATISLFTKILGPLCSAKTIGNMWGMSSLAPALIQIVFSSEIVTMFSTWNFAVFALPALLALSIVVIPSGWNILDESSQETKSVLLFLRQRNIDSVDKTDKG